MFISIKTKLVVLISLYVLLTTVMTSYGVIHTRERQGIDSVNSQLFSFMEILDIQSQKTNKVSGAELEYLMPYYDESNDFIWRYNVYNKDGNLLNKTLANVEEFKIIDTKQLRLKSVNNSLETINGEIIYFNNIDDIKGDFIRDATKVDEASLRSETNKEYKKDQSGQSVRIWYFLKANDHKIKNIILNLDNRKVELFIGYDELNITINTTKSSMFFLGLYIWLIGVVVIYFFADTIITPLKILQEKVKKIAQGNLRQKINVYSNDEIGCLSESILTMANEIDQSQKAKIFEQRTKKELELATYIQKKSLPKEIPKIKGIDIAVSLNPASEIGGDGYDVIDTHDGEYVVYLGDATGHGVSAGLIVSIANAIIYSYRHFSLSDIIRKANKVLYVKTPPNVFFTLVLLKWNTIKQNLTFVNAGHEKVLKYTAKTNSLEFVEYQGLALGMLYEQPKVLRPVDIKLDKNDFLLLHTDGITEAVNKAGHMYGIENLKQSIEKIGKKDLNKINSEKVITHILKDLKKFIVDTPLADDLTLMVIKKD